MTRPLFIQAQHRGYFRFTLFTSLLAFAWILCGIYTQTTGAALACPDWPQCFGFFTAPHTPLQIQLATERFPNTAINLDNIRLEVLYRYLSAAVLACIIILTIAATTLENPVAARSFFLCCSLLLLSSAEITLRLKTAMENQQPRFLLSHALIAFAIASLLWWLNRTTHTPKTHHQSYQNIKPWAWLSMLFVLLIVISLSIDISYVHAACAHLNVLNLGNHTLLNTLLSQQALNFLAFLSLGYLCVFSSTLLFNRQVNHLAIFILILVAAEFLITKLSSTGIDLTLSILCQTAIAIFLLMATISLLIHAYRTPQRYW